MAKSKQLLKNEKLAVAEDFFELKKLGLSYVQKLSGEEWTDYNAHDPGVTILEQLCFGLTDIAFRTNFPIEDILATPPKGLINPRKNSFHSPSAVFSNHPVTLVDFRKLIIDSFEEIQNAWLIPLQEEYKAESLNGLYKLEIMPSLAFSKELEQNPGREEGFLKSLREYLEGIRNLGEYFEELVLLKPEPFVLSAEIEIKEELEPNKVMAEILFELEKYLYQTVAYSSFEELMVEGLSLKEIFSGPRLQGGFIKSKELKPRARGLLEENFQSIFSKIDGVKKTWNLELKLANGEDPQQVGEGKYFNLITKITNPDAIYHTLKIRINENPQLISQSMVDEYLLELWSKNFRQYQHDLYKDSFLDSKLKGRFRNLGNYTSISHHFPRIYGIGKEGLSSQDPEERKAKANQLKGYLLLMEQLMGNYLSQLSNFSDLIDPKSGVDGPTYFSQKINSVVGLSELLDTSGVPNEMTGTNESSNHFSGEKIKQKYDRKNRILDHFLGRFGEDLSEVPFKVARQVNLIFSEQRFQESLINAKASLLEKIDRFNYYRGIGQRFSGKKASETYGIEKLISLKAGISKIQESLLGEIDKHHPSSYDEQLSTSKTHLDKDKLTNTYRPLNPHEWERINEPSNSERLSFGKIPVKNLFANPLQSDSYMISQKKSLLRNWEILFQKTSTNWVRIWEGKKLDEGFRRIGATIQHIRMMNLDSEGLFLVDHILLKEMLKGSEYGFYLTNGKGEVTFTSNWNQALIGRTELLTEFFQAAISISNYHVDGIQVTLKSEQGKGLATAILVGSLPKNQLVENLWEETRRLVYLMNGDVELQGVLALKEVEKIRLTGTLSKEGRVQQNKLVLARRLPSKDIIGESFFNLRASLILPDWPARFQENHFRYFVETLAKNRIPAHLNLSVYWKNLDEIKEFQKRFFAWKEALIQKSEKLYSTSLSLYRLLHKWEEER